MVRQRRIPLKRCFKTTAALIVVLTIGLSEIASAAPAAPRKQNFQRTYTISDEAPTLCEVGLLLYGNCRAYKKIARWNKINPPHRITPGQVLTIRDRPIPRKKGRKKLLAFWRKKLGLTGPVPRTSVALSEKVGKVPETKGTPKSEYEQALEAAKNRVVTGPIVIAPSVETAPMLEETATAANPAGAVGAAPVAVAMVAPKAEPAPQPAVGNIVLQLPPKEAEKETRILAAEEELELGKTLFNRKEYPGALETFSRLRNRQPKFLPSWIYEIRSLKALSREEDASKTVTELVIAIPEMKPAFEKMPLLAPYLKGGSQ